MGTRAKVHCMLLRATEDGEIEMFLQMHALSRGDAVHATSDATSSPSIQAFTTSPTEAYNKSDCEWTLPWVEAEKAENLLIQTGTASERRWAVPVKV